MQIFKCGALKETSNGTESEGDFRVRLGQAAREEREVQKEKLRQKYTPKLATITEQIRKAQARVEKEKAQANQQVLSTVMSIGSTVLGAVFGRKITSATNISKATTGLKGASKVFSDRQDVAQANETVEAYQQKYADLDAEFNAELAKLEAALDPATLQLEQVAVQPKKSDITVQQVVFAWVPWSLSSDGKWNPLS